MKITTSKKDRYDIVCPLCERSVEKKEGEYYCYYKCTKAPVTPEESLIPKGTVRGTFTY